MKLLYQRCPPYTRGENTRDGSQGRGEMCTNKSCYTNPYLPGDFSMINCLSQVSFCHSFSLLTWHRLCLTGCISIWLYFFTSSFSYGAPRCMWKSGCFSLVNLSYVDLILRPSWRPEDSRNNILLTSPTLLSSSNVLPSSSSQKTTPVHAPKISWRK